MGKAQTPLTPPRLKTVACAVKAMKRLTPSSVLLTLDPGELAPLFEGRPGQSVTFCLNVDGQECYRNYNLVNTEDALPQVAVKQVQEGGVSQHFNSAIHVGDVLNVAPPEGDFYPEDLDDAAHHLVLFAAGSGITPLISIAQHALRVRPDNKVTLFYSNSDARQIMFRERLDRLAASSRFEVFHVLGDGATGEDLSTGRLTGSKVKKLLSQYTQGLPNEYAFISGPMGFTETVVNGIGKTANPLPYSTFSFQRQRHGQGADKIRPTTEVILSVGGLKRTIPNAPQHLTLLEAADRAGIDMPADCRSGICHRCKARITAGRTTSAELDSPTKAVPKGHILCCQQRPSGDRLELEMD